MRRRAALMVVSLMARSQAGEQLQALPIGVFVSTGFAAVLHLPNECVCQCHCFPC
jgi:hypothetical protein